MRTLVAGAAAHACLRRLCLLEEPMALGLARLGESRSPRMHRRGAGELGRLLATALLLSLSLLILAGCGGSTPPAQHPPGPQPNVQQPPAQQGCDVWMEMRAKHHGTEIFAVEDAAPTQRGVCLKKTGQPLRVPDEVFLWSKDIAHFQNRKVVKSVCAEGTLSSDSSGAGTCRWRSLFRTTYPFEIQFLTRKAQATKARLPLSDFIGLVRVYRNGDTLFAWNGTGKQGELLIPACTLSDSALPFDAPLDLQIVPAGVSVDHKVVAETASEVTHQWTAIAKAAELTLSAELATDPDLS